MAIQGQQDAITLGICRVVIGVQLVIVGFQLPAKYQLHRWKEMFICLIPNMTCMWLATSGCVLLLVPRINFVSFPLSPNRSSLGTRTDLYTARCPRHRLLRHLHRPHPLASNRQRPLCRPLRCS
ncbi:hypothetical protein BJY04DRAFT_141207 [Aspergillus karnatakaensis]|uniref:uncharacterized protein n=1 Tax=Aspergillus karnatakaensis TaxID=1810916 RepID=UPI003CCDB57C